MPVELQPQPRPLCERRRDLPGESGRLQADEPAARPTGVGDQPSHQRLVSGGQSRGQVDDEQVDRSTRQQGAGEREPFAGVVRTDDEEPAQVDAARDRLERVEGPAEIEIGHDRACPLCLRHAAERQRRLAARGVAAEDGARLARQAARPEECIEDGEAGRDDLIE